MPERAPSPPAVLVVDDEPGILRLVAVALAGAGFSSILTLEDSRNVVPTLERRHVSVMILDLQMPHISGLDILEQVRQHHPGVAVIVLTANSEIETAVRCMKLGAFDYLVKPVDLDHLVAVVRNARKIGDLRDQVSTLRHHLLYDTVDYEKALTRVVTVNQQMYGIFRLVAALPQVLPPVLVTGEAGTGRERLCRYIHENRAPEDPFLSVDTAPMTDEQFVTEAFGYRRSILDRASAAPEAKPFAGARGTLCLRNIDSLGREPLERLLRLVDEGTYVPLNGATPIRSTVRLLLTASANFDERARHGAVPKPLAAGLESFRIHVPALRERIEDVPYLLDYFLTRESGRLSRKKPAIPGSLIERLFHYSFPGNVGELEELVATVVAESDPRSDTLKTEAFLDRLDPEALHENGGGAKESSLLQTFGHFPTVDETIDYLIQEALKATHGNKAAAATLLQITRQTINRRIRLKKNAVS